MKTLKIAGICALCGQITAILLLLAISLMIRNSDDPAKNAWVLSLSAVTAVSAASGAAAGFFDRESPLFCGFLCGALSAAASLLLSVIPGGQKPVWQSVLLLAMTVLPSFLCAAAVGKLTGTRGAAGKRRRRRRKRKN